MDIIPALSSKSVTKDTTFANYLLIVDTYYKLPKLYGMGNIITKEVRYKLGMLQAIFGKLDGFGCWDMDIIQTNNCTQFTSKEFQEDTYVRGV